MEKCADDQLLLAIQANTNQYIFVYFEPSNTVATSSLGQPVEYCVYD